MAIELKSAGCGNAWFMRGFILQQGDGALVFWFLSVPNAFHGTTVDMLRRRDGHWPKVGAARPGSSRLKFQDMAHPSAQRQT